MTPRSEGADRGRLDGGCFVGLRRIEVRMRGFEDWMDRDYSWDGFPGEIVQCH